MPRRIRPQKSSSQLAWAPIWDCQYAKLLPWTAAADGGSIARPVVLDGPDGLLRLRKDLADGDAQLGAGLQDPHAGLLEREVVPVGPRDEAIQDRIVEGPPPVPVGGRLGADTLVPGLPPVRRDGDLGPLVVRPDHASREGQEHRHQEDEP